MAIGAAYLSTSGFLTIVDETGKQTAKIHLLGYTLVGYTSTVVTVTAGGILFGMFNSVGKMVGWFQP
jgi:hypothetical protein